jgi:hydrogenase maturation factor
VVMLQAALQEAATASGIGLAVENGSIFINL